MHVLQLTSTLALQSAVTSSSRRSCCSSSCLFCSSQRSFSASLPRSSSS